MLELDRPGLWRVGEAEGRRFCASGAGACRPATNGLVAAPERRLFVVTETPAEPLRAERVVLTPTSSLVVEVPPRGPVPVEVAPSTGPLLVRARSRSLQPGLWIGEQREGRLPSATAMAVGPGFAVAVALQTQEVRGGGVRRGPDGLRAAARGRGHAGSGGPAEGDERAHRPGGDRRPPRRSRGRGLRAARRSQAAAPGPRPGHGRRALAGRGSGKRLRPRRRLRGDRLYASAHPHPAAHRAWRRALLRRGDERGGSGAGRGPAPRAGPGRGGCPAPGPERPRRCDASRARRGFRGDLGRRERRGATRSRHRTHRPGNIDRPPRARAARRLARNRRPGRARALGRRLGPRARGGLALVREARRGSCRP